MSKDDDNPFMPTPEELATLQSRHGKMNPKGIAYLREQFDTFRSEQAVQLLKETRNELNRLVDEAQQIHNAAREIIDDDTFMSVKYDYEEHGDIGMQADHLRMCLSELEDKIEAARIFLAPFERLIPVDEDMDLDEGMVVAFDENSSPRLLDDSAFFDED